MKKIAYICEAALLHVFFLLCRLLPLDAASGLGGWVGRTLGPRMAASRKALANIALAMPDLPGAERARIVKEMWDNLGRVMAEYPHLDRISATRVTLQYAGNTRHPADRKALYVSGHLANWEVLIHVLAAQAGQTVGAVYRAPNNPWVDRLLNKTRAGASPIETYSKSKTGTRQMMKAMQRGMIIGMLIDQKYNEGLPVPFFGQLAMTSPAFVQLAQKFGYPVVPCRIERTGGAHFRTTVYDDIPVQDADGGDRPAEDVLTQAHELLEAWIAERPGEWLWLHRRWPGAEKRERLEAEAAQVAVNARS